MVYYISNCVTFVYPSTRLAIEPHRLGYWRQRSSKKGNLRKNWYQSETCQNMFIGIPMTTKINPQILPPLQTRFFSKYIYINVFFSVKTEIRAKPVGIVSLGSQWSPKKNLTPPPATNIFILTYKRNIYLYIPNFFF